MTMQNHIPTKTGFNWMMVEKDIEESEADRPDGKLESKITKKS